jgi:hypothetical protein
MTKEPAYILRANIRSYERVLEDPRTARIMREAAAELLAETRQRLDALIIAEATKTLH